MSIAEEVECLDCPDTSSEDGDGATTGNDKQTYCPFKHTLCVDAGGSVTITEHATQYADGAYNQLILQGGCLSSLDYVAPRGYVAAPCCPEEGSSPGTGDVDVAVSACQLLKDTTGGLLVEVHFSATGDYSVAGCGSTADPFRIEGPEIASGSLTTSPCNLNDCITVTGEGTSLQPLKVCHKSGALSAGTYGAITVDSCGHVVAYDGTSEGKSYTSNSLIIDNTLNTIEAPTTGAAQTTDFLGGSVTINQYGAITAFTAPPAGLTTVVDYLKPDMTTGTLTFSNGILTGET